MKYFLSIIFSFSFLISFSQEFNARSCYDIVEINAKLDKATTKDSISRKELVNSTRIISETPSFKILSFTYIFDGCEIEDREVNSDKFSESDKKIFNRFRPGIYVLFEKIQAIDLNGKTVYLKPFGYRIYQ